MTVEALLEKLEAEYEKLEAELPEHFLDYGRYRYSRPGEDGGGYHYAKAEIERKRERQSEIRDIQKTLRHEASRGE